MRSSSRRLGWWWCRPLLLLGCRVLEGTPVSVLGRGQHRCGSWWMPFDSVTHLASPSGGNWGLREGRGLRPIHKGIGWVEARFGGLVLGLIVVWQLLCWQKQQRQRHEEASHRGVCCCRQGSGLLIWGHVMMVFGVLQARETEVEAWVLAHATLLCLTARQCCWRGRWSCRAAVCRDSCCVVQSAQ